MRILQVLDKAAHDGGVAVHVAALSEALRQRGHEVETLRLFDAASPPQPSAPGDSHRLPFSYGLLPGLRQSRALARVLRAASPQLIHLHGSFTRLSTLLLADLQACAPVVGTLHDTRPFCYLMTRRFGPTGLACTRRCGAGCFSSGCVRPSGAVDAVRLARRWVLDGLNLRQWCRLDRIVVPSAYLGELARQHGIPAQRLRVVPHGTPMPPPGRDAPAQVCDAADQSEPCVVYLGSLVDYKGVTVLVDALAGLVDLPWHAVIAGEGPLHGELERQIERLGLQQRVSLPGQLLERAAIDAVLAGARLLVLPSTVPESFGLAGLEALALGTPVVSFGLGGVAEWLRDGDNGLVASDGDAIDLARQMRRLLDDATLARRLGDNGRDAVRRRFTADMAIDRIIAVYAELVPPASALPTPHET